MGHHAPLAPIPLIVWDAVEEMVVADTVEWFVVYFLFKILHFYIPDTNRKFIINVRECFSMLALSLRCLNTVSGWISTMSYTTDVHRVRIRRFYSTARIEV